MILGQPSLRFSVSSVTIYFRAGTDALVAVSHGVHGVRFNPNFTYMGWTGLKQAKQLTSGKYSKDAGLPLTR
jgi:hypothetical protein